MKLFYSYKIVTLLGLLLLCVVLGADVEYPDVSEDGDVDLFINFTSGSKIVNESPKVLLPIEDVVVISGQEDSLLAVLPRVFHDHENGTALSFSARNSDTSLVKLRFNRADSSVTARFSRNKTGRADIRITADDGVLRTTDTFSVIIKERFTLKENLPDLSVEKRARDTIRVDLGTYIKRGAGEYTYLTSSDGAVTIINSSSQVIDLVPDTKELISYELKVRITAPDSQTVTDSFTLTVKERKRLDSNPGLSLFTGIEYSGGGVQLLYKDRLGVGAMGYSYWDRRGYGGNLKLSYHIRPQFLIHPYVLLFGGYHHQTIEDTGVGERELTLVTGGAGVGGELRLGTSGRHAFSLEFGYRYGKGEYSVGATTVFGSHYVEMISETFELSPFFIELAYRFYFGKRAFE